MTFFAPTDAALFLPRPLRATEHAGGVCDKSVREAIV